METPALITDLMQFLDASSVNFLAVKEICRRLDAAGFTRLDPAEHWTLTPGGKYYITQNDSAIIAFIPAQTGAASPYRIITAHSDSPGFRIKPHAEMIGEGGIVRLNTEV